MEMMFVIHVISLLLQSQNLVENGDFELYDNCINQYGQLRAAKGWSDVEPSSSDYFNILCNTPDGHFNCPKNSFGYQLPHSGTGYVGFCLFDKSTQLNIRQNFFWREYLQTMLREPLQKDIEYEISMFISLADYSIYKADFLSVCFSNQKLKIIDTHSFSLLSCDNSIAISLKPINDDRSNWYRLSTIYKAKGGERLLSIGLFFEDMTFKEYRKLVNSVEVETTGNTSYYYVDDVSLIPLSLNFTTY